MMVSRNGVVMWPMLKQTINNVRTYTHMPNGPYFQTHVELSKLDYFFITPVIALPPAAVRDMLKQDDYPNTSCVIVEAPRSVGGPQPLVQYGAMHAFKNLNLCDVKAYHEARQLAKPKEKLIGEHAWVRYVMKLELPEWTDIMITGALEKYRGVAPTRKRAVVEVLFFVIFFHGVWIT